MCVLYYMQDTGERNCTAALYTSCGMTYAGIGLYVQHSPAHATNSTQRIKK